MEEQNPNGSADSHAPGTKTSRGNGRSRKQYIFATQLELVRLAMPKRVYTLSHVKFVADRIGWLYENRHIIGGLEFVDEPSTLRFFLGKLKPVSDWQEQLVAKFEADMPGGL